MPRFLQAALLLLFIIQCSNNSTPELTTSKVLTEHFSILDSIPHHIKELDHLTIFPGDSKPQFSIELIQKQTYGKTGEPYLTNILDIVVDDQGRVIILDTKSDYSHVIYVFNDDGTFYTQLGSPGRGPGEYGLVVGMQAKALRIFVLDSTNLRLNEYSTTDYSLVRSILYERWNNDDEFRFGYVEARNDGNFLINLSELQSKVGRSNNTYIVMDYEGNKVSFEPFVFPDGYSIGVGEVMRPSMPLSFMGKTITALSDYDELYSIWTPEFLIKKYDANGKYLSSIFYTIQGIPFGLDGYEKPNRFSPDPREIRNAFASMDAVLPEMYPVINNLIVDDENRIWVSVQMDTYGEMFEWWILAPTGELLAKLQRPHDEPIFDIKNGFLYSRETDENTGVEFVVKYSIELAEHNGEILNY